MPIVACDRLLETCVRNDGEAVVLAVGSPPHLRCWSGLRTFQTPALNAIDLRTILDQVAPGTAEDCDEEYGYTAFDLRYGTEYQFRVAVFGGATPSAAVMARVPRGTRAIVDDEETHIASAGGARQLSAFQILGTCVESGAYEVLLVPGCPPLLRSDRGLHAFRVRPLDADGIDVMLREFETRSITEQKEGYREFDFPFSDTYWFRAAVFGEFPPTLVMLMARRR